MECMHSPLQKYRNGKAYSFFAFCVKHWRHLDLISEDEYGMIDQNFRFYFLLFTSIVDMSNNFDHGTIRLKLKLSKIGVPC